MRCSGGHVSICSGGFDKGVIVFCFVTFRFCFTGIHVHTHNSATLLTPGCLARNAAHSPCSLDTDSFTYVNALPDTGLDSGGTTAERPQSAHQPGNARWRGAKAPPVNLAVNKGPLHALITVNVCQPLPRSSSLNQITRPCNLAPTKVAAFFAVGFVLVAAIALGS